jgi:two-component system, cell cycle response regulator
MQPPPQPTPTKAGAARPARHRETRRTPWTQDWSRDDIALLGEGATGERMFAVVRFLLVLAMATVPAAQSLLGDAAPQHRIALIGASVALVIAGGILVVVSRGPYRSWYGYATSLFDVTAISAVLLAVALSGHPHAALNSRVLYSVYFVAIFATCLRYDPRLSLTAGLLAAIQYAGIVAFAMARWNLRGPEFEPLVHGQVYWSDQASRVVLLVGATVVATLIVTRAVRLRRLSVRDGLTKVSNRAYFEERLTEELLRAKRYNRPLTLALLDVDRFKQFNDTYGHPAGDEALRAVGSLLRRAVRRTDVVARYGGEEFAIILPETPAESALPKLEAIRQATESLDIDTPRGTLHAPLTLSAGVASYPADGVLFSDILHAADDRLMDAKRQGRNRVVAPPPSTSPPEAVVAAPG